MGGPENDGGVVARVQTEETTGKPRKLESVTGTRSAVRNPGTKREEPPEQVRHPNLGKYATTGTTEREGLDRRLGVESEGLPSRVSTRDRWVGHGGR